MITVKDFLEAGREKLALELVHGADGLDRPIPESAINRPGLALAGVYRHFPFRRIQVFGLAETDYLLDMNASQRLTTLQRLFQQKIPCLVICRNRKIWPEIGELAEQHNVPVLRTPLITRTFINLATIIMETLAAPHVNMQGTMVDIMGIGVLIEGRPGIGKSEAALALVARGYSLVADDVTLLRRTEDGALIGTAAGVTRYHMEIRGLGIIHVPSLFGVAAVRDQKELDLIVSLCKFEDFERADDQGGARTREVLGVAVPNLLVPVAPGRELANVIEVAALNEKLKRLGHDAAKELDAKLVAVMTKAAAAETSEN